MNTPINFLTAPEVETLTALVEQGPLPLTEVPCKRSAGVLVVRKWVACICIRGEHRYAATYEGERLYCAYYDGNSFTEAFANRLTGKYDNKN